MRKFIVIFLVLFSIQPVLAVGSTTTDHYAFKYCRYLRNNNILKYSVCSHLNSPISKGEFVKIVLYVAGIAEDTNAPSIASDVTDDFVLDAVNTAIKQGIVTGEGGVRSNSGASGRINRAVAVTIGGRAYGIIDKFGVGNGLDDIETGAWYAEYASRAVSAGVIVGKLSDGNRYFKPADIITYGEAMSMAFQFERVRIIYNNFMDDGGAGVPSLVDILSVDPLAIYLNDTKTVCNEKSCSDSLKLTAIPFSQGNVPAGANNVLFGRFEVHGNETIQEITLHREGPGSERDFEQVYLYYADSTAENSFPVRVTSGKSIDSTTQQINFILSLPVQSQGLLEIHATLSQTASASSQHRFRILKVKTDKRSYEYNADDPSKATTYSDVAS